MLMTVQSFICIALLGSAFMGMLFLAFGALCTFDKDLDIITCRVDTVSMLVNTVNRLDVEYITYVLLPCAWQSVYCASNSSVAVGPTTSYSAVPATQYLCLSDLRDLHGGMGLTAR